MADSLTQSLRMALKSISGSKMKLQSEMLVLSFKKF